MGVQWLGHAWSDSTTSPSRWEASRSALEFYGRIFEIDLRGRSGRMAFIEIGDQFVALSEGRRQGPDDDRHFGLVVDSKETDPGRARRGGSRGIACAEASAFSDPWGNNVEVVEYAEIQFTKAPWVLAGMGLEGLDKSEQAIQELRQKGLASTSRPEHST